MLTSARIFAGSINCKWLTLTAFTLRERSGGQQRAGCHGEETGWLSYVDRGTAVISYLSPLFGLHTLRVQHNHWKREEVEGERESRGVLYCHLTISIKHPSSSNGVCFVPSLLTFIINYPATPWQHNEVPSLMLLHCIKFWVWCPHAKNKSS